jgi:uncharacterized protein with HEPN domain
LTGQREQSKRADVLRVADMEQAAALLDEARAMGKARFLADRILQDAVVRRFEILGEAAGHVSKRAREAYPRVEWAKMRGFASFAKHEYWRVDLDRLWAAVEEAPVLRRELAKVRLDHRKVG